MLAIARIGKNIDGKFKKQKTVFLAEDDKWVTDIDKAIRFERDEGIKKANELSDKYIYSFIFDVDFGLYKKEKNSEEDKTESFDEVDKVLDE